MSDTHDHSDEIKAKLCCGADILQKGINKAMQRIEEKNATNSPCLYPSEGEYADILAQFLKNRQKRLIEINKATGESWTELEKIFEKLKAKGFQLARYMQTHESDMAESLNLMSCSKEKAFVVYSNYNILDEQKRLSLLLYAASQPYSAYNTHCQSLSSDTDSKLFEEVIATFNSAALNAQIGDYPSIIALTGNWIQIDYSEIDNADMDFHLEVRVGMKQPDQDFEL